MNISAKLKVSASKSATSPSCKPLCLSLQKPTPKKMKIGLTEEIKTEIDFMLSELLKGNPCSDNKHTTELRATSIRICKSLNLIKLSLSGKQYELTENGILAFSDGGIEKYLFNIRTEKDLDTDIKQLTLKKLKFEQFPARFWWLIILITSIVSILTTLVNNKIEKSINQQEQPKKEIILNTSDSNSAKVKPKNIVVKKPKA